MNINIYLAIQKFKDGRVMYRRWSPQLKSAYLGGAFHPQTVDATEWLAAAGNPKWDNNERDSTLGGVFPDCAPFTVIDVPLEIVAASRGRP